MIIDRNNNKKQSLITEVLLGQTSLRFALLDRDLRYVLLSEKLAQFDGKPVSDHIGKHIREFVPKLVDEIEKIAAKILKTGKPIEHVEFSGYYPVSSTVKKYWESNWHPVLNENVITGFIVFLNEITRRKRAETALTRSTRKYRELVENVNSVVLRWKSNGTISFMNKYGLKFFGYKSRELIGKNVNILVPDFDSIGNDLTRFGNKLTENPEQYLNNINENICKDGSRVWMSWTNKAVFTEKGALTEILAIGNDITDLKKINDALKISENQNVHLASFPKLNPNPVMEISLSGEFLFCNAGAQKALESQGLDPDDCSPFLPEDIHDFLYLLRTGESDSFYRQISLHDRSYAEIIQLLPNFKSIRIYAHDITERTHMEQALLVSERKYRNLFGNIEELVAVFEVERDGTGRIIERRLNEANPAFLRATGFSSVEEIRGKTSSEIFGKGWSDFHQPFIQAAMDTGQVQVQESYHSRSGKYYMISIVRQDERTYIGAGWDITERKKMEEELRRSKDELEIRVFERTKEALSAVKALEAERQHFREVLDGLPVYVVILTPDHTVRFANRMFLERFGDAQELRCFEHLFQRTEPCEDCESYVVLATMKPHEWEWRGPDGRTYNVHDFPFHDTDGTVSVLEMGMDITERKTAEKDRKRLEERLRQSHKMEAIGTLAGGIAHDFNNILAAILGFSEMALDDAADGIPVERSIQNIHTSAIRARDLVKQILAFSRKTNYERIPISLLPLIKETIKLIRASIPATIDIKIFNTVESDIVRAAPTEIQQIVMNLATNAFLAMSEKGGVLEIHLTDVAITPDLSVWDTKLIPGQYIQLMVKDTGVGMSPKVMKRIFEPFFTTREQGEGTGMGLAVVYGIVKDLEGEIMIESKPGSGSVFRVFLPRAQEKRKKRKRVYLKTGTESILFIDDEDMLVQWAQIALKKLGYRVIAVNDPDEAIRIFSSAPYQFHLVITDQAMPKMSGLQLADKCFEIRPDIPIILCTGHSAIVSADVAKKAGIKKLLIKPLMKSELSVAIRDVLEK